MKTFNEFINESDQSKPLHTVTGEDGEKYSVKKGNNDFQVHRHTGATTTHHIDSYSTKEKAIDVANSLAGK